MTYTYRTVILLLLAGFTWTIPEAAAQGVTRAAMHGTVVDTQGEPLPGANVLAIHTPTGTRYGTATNAQGRFLFRAMRIGGPYTVRVTFIGYKPAEQTGIRLQLGEDRELNVVLEEEARALDQVVVVGEESDLNSDRSGISTFVQEDAIEALPTISRSTQDFTRLTPQASGLSFGGRNTQYNNFSVDGSIFNNPYGLDSPVPGGQTSAQPISLDAVEQVQVSIAPFDVRQGGFTGAGVNTVTKSGTNDLTATAYYFTRNENLIGDQVGSATLFEPDLTFNQAGISVGGPIIEDKLFFFVNGEIVRRDDPGSVFSADTDGNPNNNGPNVSRVQADVMERISQRLQEEYNYDTGGFGRGYLLDTTNDKLLAKLDWNIATGQTATLRFNYLNAAKDLNANPVAIFRRGPNQNTLPFENAGYTINNDIYSIVGEYNGSFGTRYTNKTIIGYTAFRDNREPFSTPFPTLEIFENGLLYTTAGHEPFSINNLLDQDVFQFTNNFSIFAGRHTITLGVNYEQFWFNNSFNLFKYGLFVAPVQFGGTRFQSLDDFFAYTDPSNPSCSAPGVDPADGPCFLELNEFVPDNPTFAFDETNVGQGALYVQDEYTVSDRLEVTAGLRVDMPVYYMDIPRNEAIASLRFRNNERIDTSELPEVRPLWSPRVGFNWDVLGDRTTQIRGGSGIFTGRLPFVWIGNQVTNQGTDNPSCINTPNNDGCLGIVNALSDDFRWPQVWKSSLAIDQRLPGNVIATVNALYGNDLNAIVVRNANLARPTGTAPDGRPTFGNVTNPGNETSTRINDEVAGAYVMDNTNEGYQWSVTGELKKQFDLGVNARLAYTYSQARNKLTSTEIAQVLFEGNPVSVDPNNPELSFSEFGLKHRIIGAASYRVAYAERYKTTVGMFFEVGRGDRFSYTYAGDMNGDGVINNDLMYVPTGPGDINLVNPSNWSALNRYITQDEYLSSVRGAIAERNGALSPWFATLDLQVAQDFTLDVGSTANTLRVSLNIFNVPNLLNSAWGVREVPISTQVLRFERYNAAGEPVFEWIGPQRTFQDNVAIVSRWRAQLGIRYIFN
ncbi:TonB-dependent receptor [Salisaeta longa]|uniref:TonB-dependent receptor n=1 Tax=Salisaeta longa TaxID=503170 RepID=UPI0003B63D06|nr:carboxypeptidase regulatory-like domain-containing protein [Salisaeta longa]